jgi:hypothetical protein
MTALDALKQIAAMAREAIKSDGEIFLEAQRLDPVLMDGLRDVEAPDALLSAVEEITVILSGEDYSEREIEETALKAIRAAPGHEAWGTEAPTAPRM